MASRAWVFLKIKGGRSIIASWALIEGKSSENRSVSYEIRLSIHGGSSASDMHIHFCPYSAMVDSLNAPGRV